MKKLLLTILLLLSFLSISQLQIGFGTSNKYTYPAYGLYDYSKSMFIYTQSELGSSKNITEIEFQIGGYTVPYTYNGQYLQLAHTTDNEFGTNVKVDLTNLNNSNLTIVKNNFTFTISTNGWTTISFDTPFNYNGIDNLLIIWENWDGSWSSGYGYSESVFDNCSCASDYLSWYKYSDNSFPTGYGTRDKSYRPNIKISSVSPLHINLLSFDVVKNNRMYDFEWITTLEKNINRYELEFTHDGNNFYKIASIPSKGDVYSKTTYKYEKELDFIEPIVYFRLLYVNNDNSITYSNLISILNKKPKVKKIIKYYDMSGREVDEYEKGILIVKYEDGSYDKIIK